MEEPRHDVPMIDELAPAHQTLLQELESLIMVITMLVRTERPNINAAPDQIGAAVAYDESLAQARTGLPMVLRMIARTTIPPEHLPQVIALMERGDSAYRAFCQEHVGATVQLMWSRTLSQLMARANQHVEPEHLPGYKDWMANPPSEEQIARETCPEGGLHDWQPCGAGMTCTKCGAGD